MTENKRLIHGSYGEQRYLHSDEVFRKERNWNMNLPSEREFKNGYCIITDKDNTAYSIDELVELLNEFQKENEQLKQQLQKIQNSFEVNWTQNHVEFDKDKLYIKDNNTEIRLDDKNLFIEVYIPQINEYYHFKYIVTGRSLMIEFIENYDSNGDDE